MTQVTEPEKHLPLTSVVFEILLVLAEGEKHGYAIMSAVRGRTAGRLTLHPGTLYRAIGRMMKLGYVEELDERPDPQLDDQRRRYYRMTGLGRRVAEAEARRLASQVAAARAQRLLGRGVE